MLHSEPLDFQAAFTIISRSDETPADMCSLLYICDILPQSKHSSRSSFSNCFSWSYSGVEIHIFPNVFKVANMFREMIKDVFCQSQFFMSFPIKKKQTNIGTKVVALFAARSRYIDKLKRTFSTLFGSAFPLELADAFSGRSVM